MALKKNQIKVVENYLGPNGQVQVEFSLVAGFWVGITYISNEPGDGVNKKLFGAGKSLVLF